MTRPLALRLLLRAVLVVAGIVIVLLSLNVGFGGIATLGWQGGSAPFLTVTDPAIYAIRDNHVRFIGGVWLAAGLAFIIGGFAFQRMRPILVAITAMIFVGGLARFSAGNPALLFSLDLAPSVILELVLFPLLGVWIFRAERTPHAAV